MICIGMALSGVYVDVSLHCAGGQIPHWVNMDGIRHFVTDLYFALRSCILYIVVVEISSDAKVHAVLVQLSETCSIAARVIAHISGTSEIETSPHTIVTRPEAEAEHK